ncbi:MAG: restriction endonuclease [Bacteroides sp.]|nr:restriction endonuclease [Bacteroides sp.]MCM1086006.1 restriction endonuclease [Bacteroides sp.]
MNIFTQQSIELANQRNYLDLLFSVYPLAPDSIRTIDQDVWNRIEQCYHQDDNKELFKALLKLELFPIKDGYVPYFRLDPSAIERNPHTINRICGRIRELRLDKLYEKCTQPKETNRQMGPLFRNWIEQGTLGVYPVCESEFSNSKDNAILRGTDAQLKEFAQKNLGFTREDKGIDLLARFNGHYIIGEAKFISAEGGHQNDQFLDAKTSIKSSSRSDVTCIAILDGVLYIPSKKKMYTTITSQDIPVMSALLLRDYLYSL